MIDIGQGLSLIHILKSVGYDKIIEEENLEFVDMNYGPFIDLEIGRASCRERV